MGWGGNVFVVYRWFHSNEKCVHAYIWEIKRKRKEWFVFYVGFENPLVLKTRYGWVSLQGFSFGLDCDPTVLAGFVSSCRILWSVLFLVRKIRDF
jgi:hypothetical protein